MSKLSITTVQTDLFWQNKPANLEMLDKKLRTVPAGTVVVLPEMFNTGFSMEPKEYGETMTGETVSWMREVAASQKCILTGSLIIQEKEAYHNRLVWMLPNGTLGYYDKRHLFGFAGEDKHYTAGKKRLVAQVNGWRILLLVCYDLRFPVWSRQQSKPDARTEYDAIVYVANWPEGRIAAWRSLLIARAIENQAYVIGVNRVGCDGKGIQHNGNSMLINPLGEVLYEAVDKEEIATHVLDFTILQSIRDKFPFLKDSDHFTIG